MGARLPLRRSPCQGASALSEGFEKKSTAGAHRYCSASDAESKQRGLRGGHRVQSIHPSRVRYAPNCPGKRGGDMDHCRHLLSQFADPPVNPGLL